VLAGKGERDLVELRNVADVLVVLVAALAGGMVAGRLRQPVLLGYLIGGVIVGPYGLELVDDVDLVDNLAVIGVVALMFALGVEFSLGQLRRVGGVAAVGGGIQILLTGAIGFGLAQAFGWTSKEGLFFGAAIALSSTMIVLKVLSERGELSSVHGRIALGLLLFQDISVVPLMVVLTTVSDGGGAWAAELGIAVAKAAGFLVAAYLLGTRIIPWLLTRVAALRSRELFLLTIVAIVIGAAYATSRADLSVALGAFLAGLIVSESDYAHEALAEVIPLRDIFAILFFVSIGMLTQPSFVVDHVALLAVVISVIIAAKFIICGGLTWAFGYSAKTTLLVGAAMFQIGEFSFVLARVGVDRHVVSDTVYQVVLASAIITMLLTPLALLGASQGYFRLLAPRFTRLALRRSDPGIEGARALEISNHVVICGHGRVGRELSRVLERRNLCFVVIDLDPHVIAHVRDRGCPAIYGDCAHKEVLALAQLPRARVLVITVPDPIAIERATAHARQINPRLDIVVRLHGESDISLLRDIGATELVQPEFEAGMEVVRHTLARYGLTGPEIQFIIAKMREERTARGEP